MKPITLSEANDFDREAYRIGVEALNNEQLSYDIEQINFIIQTRLDEIKSQSITRHFVPTSPLALFYKALESYEDFKVVWYQGNNLLFIELVEKSPIVDYLNSDTSFYEKPL